MAVTSVQVGLVLDHLGRPDSAPLQSKSTTMPGHMATIPFSTDLILAHASPDSQI